MQRDYDGTPMITDILPDEFLYDLWRKRWPRTGDGCIQFTQSGASENSFGIDDDFRFLEKMCETCRAPVALQRHHNQ